MPFVGTLLPLSLSVVKQEGMPVPGMSSTCRQPSPAETFAYRECFALAVELLDNAFVRSLGGIDILVQCVTGVSDSRSRAQRKTSALQGRAVRVRNMSGGDLAPCELLDMRR